jgi:hypothetical protein
MWLTGKQRYKSGMAGESFRAGQDPQRVVVPIIIIIGLEAFKNFNAVS